MVERLEGETVMQAQTANQDTQQKGKYRSPPPRARVAPGSGETPMLSVRLGDERLSKLRRCAEAAGLTPSEYMRMLVDLIPSE